MMEKPPKISRWALVRGDEEYNKAVTYLADEPFWMPFILINQEVLKQLIHKHPQADGRFHFSARQAVKRTYEMEGDREALSADIQMHPLIDDRTKADLLRDLYPEGQSISAMSGGLPGLGKRR